MDEVAGPEPDEVRTKCANGHDVPAGQAFCGKCGAAAQSDAPNGSPPTPTATGGRGRWLIVGASLALLGVIGIVAALSMSGGGENPSQSADQEPTVTATPSETTTPPTMQEMCVDEVLAIVEPMVEEWAATGQYGTSLRQAQGEYGLQHPLFLMTIHRVVPPTIQQTAFTGREAGLQTAAIEAYATCKEELSP